MSYRGFISIATALLALAAVAPVSGAERDGVPRNTTSRYDSGSYNTVASSSEEPLYKNLAEPLVFAVMKNERWAALSIQDQSGRPAPATVGQDLNGDGELDATWDVCGATETPIAITPGKALTVSVAPGACAGGTEPATSGTVYLELIAPRSRPVGPAYKVERDLAITYSGMYYEYVGGFAVGSFSVTTLPAERYMTVRATDGTGLPVHVRLVPENRPVISVCGETDKPLDVPSGTKISVAIWPGVCGAALPIGTTGTIEITLSNKP